MDFEEILLIKKQEIKKAEELVRHIEICFSYHNESAYELSSLLNLKIRTL